MFLGCTRSSAVLLLRQRDVCVDYSGEAEKVQMQRMARACSRSQGVSLASSVLPIPKPHLGGRLRTIHLAADSRSEEVGVAVREICAWSATAGTGRGHVCVGLRTPFIAVQGVCRIEAVHRRCANSAARPSALCAIPRVPPKGSSAVARRPKLSVSALQEASPMGRIRHLSRGQRLL
jgi:hypothetical protein